MRFWIFLCVLLVALVILTSATDNEPGFKLDKSEIVAGESVHLSWLWPPAKRGYLSGRGLLERPSGDKIEVTPQETTSYVLVLEAPGSSPRILTERVIVRGSKGSSGDWPDNPFDPLVYQASYDIHSSSLAEVLNKIESVLRDDEGFEVRQFSQIKDQVVFSTSFHQSNKLNDSSERPRKLRRIAYHVEVTDMKSGSIHISISTSIQWRIVVDTRWFLESSSSSERYRSATTELWKALRIN